MGTYRKSYRHRVAHSVSTFLSNRHEGDDSFRIGSNRHEGDDSSRFETTRDKSTTFPTHPGSAIFSQSSAIDFRLVEST